MAVPASPLGYFCLSGSADGSGTSLTMRAGNGLVLSVCLDGDAAEVPTAEAMEEDALLPMMAAFQGVTLVRFTAGFLAVAGVEAPLSISSISGRCRRRRTFSCDD